MTDELIGAGGDHFLPPICLKTHGGRIKAIDDRGPGDEAKPDGEENQADDLKRGRNGVRPVITAYVEPRDDPMDNAQHDEGWNCQLVLVAFAGFALLFDEIGIALDDHD